MLLALGLVAASGYILNHNLGSHETRTLEKEVSVLSEELRRLIDKGGQFTSSLQDELFARDNTYRIILQMDTLPFSLRSAGTGGSAAANELARQNDLSYQVNDMINMITNQLQIQSGSFKALYEKALEYSAGHTHMPAILPVAKSDLIMISSDFGVRSDPFFYIEKTHCGLDFVAPAEKSVYATGDGIVTFAQYSRTGYGNEIVIDHGFGFGSRYAHLNEIKVKEGEQIRRGKIIGTVGETGRATGPHLHYEVLYENKPVNPSYYFDTSLTKEEYAQIIDKAKTQDKLMN
jgi:murein DD-endopeptidase MepM/ murein hydrolase activator NlpD